MPSALNANAALRRPAEARRDVLGDAAGLARGVLRGGRARLARAAVDDVRAVAHGPDAGIVRQLEVRVGDDPPPILLTGERRHQRIGPDGTVLTSVRVAMRSPPASSAASAVAPASRVFEPDLDAALHEQVLGEAAQALGQLGQDHRARVKQHHPDLLGPHVPEALRGRPHEVVQLGQSLHPGEAAARHHEGQQALPHLGVALDVGLLQDVDGVIAQDERVAEILERQRVLGEAGLAGEARHVAEGDHEVVVLEEELLRAEARRRDHALAPEVDALDRPRVEVRARAQPPDRRDGVQDPDAPRDHLRQHRLEHDVVVAAHQPQLDLAARELGLEELLEGQGRVDTAEAAAQDQDPGRPCASHPCLLGRPAR